MSAPADVTYIAKLYDSKTGEYLGKYALSLTGLVGSDKVAEVDQISEDADEEDGE